MEGLNPAAPEDRNRVYTTGATVAAASAERIEEPRHDPSGGLPQRSQFMESLRRDLAHAAGSTARVAVVTVEVYGIGDLNLSSGYAAGDAVLRHVAQSLWALAPEGSTAARLHGARFALALAAADARDRVADVAQRLAHRLAEPAAVDGAAHSLSANFGAAVFPEDGDDAETLLRHADLALRVARDQGRGMVQFYSRDMGERQRRRALLASTLRPGMERGELVVEYQPQVELRSGKICGFEALLRWQHRELGPISRAEFGPVAAELGLMVPLGEQLLAAACRQLGAWKAAGLGELRMSVGIAPQQLCLPDAVQTLTGAVADNGVEASQIELELSENTLLEVRGLGVEQIRALRKLGFAFAIDNFGTGLCNFAFLRAFPVDSVKIDQTYVRGVTTDPADAAICTGIVSVAHALKLRVVACGVETEAELASVAGLYCDRAQGPLFGRPLDAAGATALLREGPRLAAVHDADATARTLLIVDDEPNVGLALNRALRREGYRILIANGAEEGFELLARHSVGVILSDQRMPGMNGTEFLRRVKDLYPSTVRIVLSGYTDLQSITDAINEGDIYKFLAKPWEDRELRDTLKEAFLRYEQATDNARLNVEIGATNRYLESALEAKSTQLDRGETVLRVAYEALAAIPVPVLGVDPAGMIALSNAACDALLGDGVPLIGSFAEDRLPQDLLDHLARPDGGAPAVARLAGADYLLLRRALGQTSSGAGTLLTLLRREP